jgi:hypothetical protein
MDTGVVWGGSFQLEPPFLSHLKGEKQDEKHGNGHGPKHEVNDVEIDHLSS